MLSAVTVFGKSFKSDTPVELQVLKLLHIQLSVLEIVLLVSYCVLAFSVFYFVLIMYELAICIGFVDLIIVMFADL